MPITRLQGFAFGVAIAVTICVLPLTLVLVKPNGWLFAGHVMFGLTIGLLVGMTRSSIVSGLLPLLFTFAGGSIVALSTGEDRTAEQVDALGKQLAGFGLGASFGLLVGLILRKLDIELPLGRLKEP